MRGSTADVLRYYHEQLSQRFTTTWIGLEDRLDDIHDHCPVGRITERQKARQMLCAIPQNTLRPNKTTILRFVEGLVEEAERRARWKERIAA